LALSQQLIKPLMPLLSRRSHWLLAPDDALNLVSMAALLDAAGRPLGERFQITYLSSGRDLLRVATQTPPARSRAVVVANPDFGSAAPHSAARMGTRIGVSADRLEDGLLFKPLPGTALEAQSLQQVLELRDTDVLMRANASEQRLRALRGPRLLHVATHGFFLGSAAPAAAQALPLADRSPLLRSGLALAGANTRRSGTQDDGIMTALEMAQLDLRGTELVVLSACETGLGEVASGEGVYGLRRALVLAGAQTQVTSLWQVSDQATRKLMVDFYQRLLRGEGRSAALRAAQSSMRADPRYQHPYYWAGFIVSGDWRPLQR
jgi:CHAT domain-containing protein